VLFRSHENGLKFMERLLPFGEQILRSGVGRCHDDRKGL
jgi:hypothetical protein